MAAPVFVCIFGYVFRNREVKHANLDIRWRNKNASGLMAIAESSG